MKRLAIFLLAIAVALAAVVAFAPTLVPRELVEERLLEQVAQWIGRPVTALGRPIISLYPRPTVRIEGVTIADADGSGRPFVSAEAVTGTVRLWPLLFGRVEISQFRIDRPTIALRVAADGAANWILTEGAIGDRVAEALRHPAADGAPTTSEVTLGRFIISGGTITYQAGDAEPTAIGEVSLDITWPSTSSPATARGSFSWRGETLAVTASLEQPLELIAGRPTPGRFSIVGDPLRIAFDGIVARTGLDFAFDGEADIVMASLRRVLSWAGADIGPGRTLGAVAIRGEARWAWPVLSFADARMELDGNAADGTFSVDFRTERPFIAGTLAAETLDLSVYAGVFTTEINADGARTGMAIDLPILALIDSDIRLSANSVAIGNTLIADLATAAVVHDGRFTISIGDASLYGGRLQGSIAGDFRAPRLSATASLNVAGLALGPALADMLGATAATGSATGSLRLAGEGDDWGALVAGLTGTLRVTVRNGSLRGVDTAAAAANPTASALTAGGGGTAFVEAAADFTFAGGRVETVSLSASGPSFALAFAGGAALDRPVIEGRGIIWFRPAAPGAAELRFRLGGTWTEPLLTDDPDAPDPLLAARRPAIAPPAQR